MTETWNATEVPVTIEYSRAAIEEIREQIWDGFRRLSHGGLEVGGILYGQRRDQTISIEAARPILCQHALGPGFVLSESDKAALGAQIREDSEEPRLKNMVCLGWFLSHTRSGIMLSPADLEIYSAYFPEPWQVTLVVHPEWDRSMRAGFFVREADGAIRTAGSYKEFSFPPRLAPAQLGNFLPGQRGMRRGMRREDPRLSGSAEIAEAIPETEPRPAAQSTAPLPQAVHGGPPSPGTRGRRESGSARPGVFPDPGGNEKTGRFVLLKNLSLRGHLSLLLGVLVLIAIGGLGRIAYNRSRSYDRSRSAIEKSAIQQVGIAANARKQALTLLLEHQRGRATTLLRAASLGCAPEETACLHGVLAGFLAKEGATAVRLKYQYQKRPLVVAKGRVPVSETDIPSNGELARFYAPGQNVPYYVIAAQATTGDGEMVIALWGDMKAVNQIFLDRHGLGESGETFLADTRGRLLTPARYPPLVLTGLEASMGKSPPARVEDAKSCASGPDFEILDQDYSGVPVIRGIRHLPEIPGVCIVALMDLSEAFAPTNKLKQEVVSISNWQKALAIAGFFFFAYCIVESIQRLKQRARVVEAGDFDTHVPLGGPPKVQPFARAFESMARSLKDSRAALEASHEKVRNMLERISDAFIACDHEWRCTYLNEKAIALAGVSREQALGKTLWELLPDLSENSGAWELHRGMELKRPLHFEMHFGAFDAWLELDGYPTRDGFELVCRDVTERKRIGERPPASGLAIAQTDVRPKEFTSASFYQRIRVHGKSLEGNLSKEPADRDVSVYLPPSYSKNATRRYPVVYLLHDYCNSDIGWFGPESRGSFANGNTMTAAADRAFLTGGVSEMILVMPNAYTIYQGSMFSNSATTGDWEAFIAKDMVEYMDSHYRTIPTRTGRGLAGHSMGGYGTIRIGMKYPHVFSSIYVLSGCCLTANLNPNPQSSVRAEALKSPEEAKGVKRGIATLLAEAAAWAPNPQNPPFYFDLPAKDGKIQPAVVARWVANAALAMVDQYATNLKTLKIGIDVGDKDGLAAGNRELNRVLNGYGIPTAFEEYDGDHTNHIVDRMEKVVLAFFTRNLQSH